MGRGWREGFYTNWEKLQKSVDRINQTAPSLVTEGINLSSVPNRSGHWRVVSSLVKEIKI